MEQQVKILGETSLYNCVIAARTCYDSMGNSDSYDDCGMKPSSGYVIGPKDRALLKRIIDSKHESVLEHKVYTFEIQGFSRAVLLELERHRISSFSVRSTRFTLKKMMKLSCIELMDHLVKTHPELDEIEKDYVWKIITKARLDGIPPDKFKHKMPESLKFECVWTINARSLRNFFELRLAAGAMWEIRELAAMVYGSINTFERGILFSEFGDKALKVLTHNEK